MELHTHFYFFFQKPSFVFSVSFKSEDSSISLGISFLYPIWSVLEFLLERYLSLNSFTFYKLIIFWFLFWETILYSLSSSFSSSLLRAFMFPQFKQIWTFPSTLFSLWWILIDSCPHFMWKQYSFEYLFISFFWPCHTACGIVVP